MRKKFISLIIALVLIFSLAIPALAYSHNLNLNYYKDVGRQGFANTISTDCTTFSFLKNLTVVLYVCNDSTGAVICNTGSTADAPISGKSLVASQSFRSIPDGTYSDHGSGRVEYIPQLSGHNEELSQTKTFTIGKSKIVSKDNTEIQNKDMFAERGKCIAESFGIKTDEYTIIVNTDIEKYIDSVMECASIRHDMNLSFGDTIPVYFLNADNDTLLAVKQDTNSQNYLYTFYKGSDNKWNLKGLPDISVSDVLYLEDFLHETAVLNGRDVFSSDIISDIIE